jgi:peptidyl-prolyl cis-trans isomerase SurA
MPRLARPLLASAALAAALALTPPKDAHASIVERVVAVVGERPILLSELRHRARPFLYKIVLSTPDAAQQAAHETEMFRELLNRMIDDRLEEQAADKAHLSVMPEEVDNALKTIAGNARIGMRELMSEARKQGLTEQDYRDEIRRQLLEGKLVQLRVRGRVRVTEQDARAAYGHWVKDMGNQASVDARILALRLVPGASPQQVHAREVLAQQIVMDARTGKDFCELVTTYSDDPTTKSTCGSRGPQPISAFIAPVPEMIGQMGEGEISNPIRVGQEAVLVVQVVKKQALPAYEEVKDAMTERAFGEAMERQRKLWLQELRRGVYVDVRL